MRNGVNNAFISNIQIGQITNITIIDTDINDFINIGDAFESIHLTTHSSLIIQNVTIKNVIIKIDKDDDWHRDGYFIYYFYFN